jgi:hypothetical protein
MTTTEKTDSGTRSGNGTNHRGRKLTAIAAMSVLIAGCAAAKAAAPPAAGTSAPATTSGTQGMSMSPAARSGGPSASALMVCGPEIRQDVVTILALTSAPTSTTTWADNLYTCTYHLPTGRLALSVKESPDTASANTYFATLRTRLAPTQPLTGARGLGNPGYETSDGTVVILKDGKTLEVDATGLPSVSGPNLISRADVAYEISTDILGCWNGK